MRQRAIHDILDRLRVRSLGHGGAPDLLATEAAEEIARLRNVAGMKVWTCIDHDGHYPVGVASVVVAETVERARELLDAQLVEHGLRPFAERKYELVPLVTEAEMVRVMNDGDY